MLSHSAVVLVLGISLSARGWGFEAHHRYVMYGNLQPEQETYPHWTRMLMMSSLKPLYNIWLVVFLRGQLWDEL